MSDTAPKQYASVAADELVRAASARFLYGQTGLCYARRFPSE
jgi:hypothetical protein